MTTTTKSAQGAMFTQPKAVYAVAFACVISFMSIGLVDPILPSLRTQLDATPSQVTLLFTSYLVVTAVAMLGTNWVSSRLGANGPWSPAWRSSSCSPPWLGCPARSTASSASAPAGGWVTRCSSRPPSR